MKEIKKVAIIGMGALGIMYGKLFLDKCGAENLRFLGNKKRIDKFNHEGVYSNDVRCDFEMIDPSSDRYHTDLLIFAVKATALEESIEMAKSVVSEDTIILSVLNGISSEEIIQEKLNKGIVIKSVAQGMDALKIGNRLSYQNFGVLCIGLSEDENTKQEALNTLLAFFQEINYPFVLEKDIQHRLWGKWMLNVGVNQVVMLYEGTFKTIQENGEARDLMIAAMNEVISIAKKAGVTLDQSDRDFYVNLMSTLNPEGMPSMRQDGVAKRKSEVELFAGTVIKKAEQFGIDVPVNKMLYQKIQEIESQY